MSLSVTGRPLSARLPGLAALLVLILGAGGCSTLHYYSQAVSGQLELMFKARPAREIVRDPTTPAELAERLELALSIRRYASTVLALPDNDSYTRYVDLGRRHVVWNVFAAPELSVEPRQWCYPVAGCVAYRGYFSDDDARRQAGRLKERGYDVYIGPVAAYSTLGWFADPLLNTFIHDPDTELAGLLFHELAHQALYVRGDTTFNESFATAVQLGGVRRWLSERGRAHEIGAYEHRFRELERVTGLLLDYRERLDRLYRSHQPDAAKRAAKTDLLARLKDDYRKLRRAGLDSDRFDRWFESDLNNAHLAAVAAYHELLPGFRALWQRHADSPKAFLEAAKDLAELPEHERRASLERLAASEP
jgi:predicted aminopeptidase